MNPTRVALVATRVALPLVMTLAGVVALIAGHGRTALAGAGVVLIGFAVIVWMINWLFRMSVVSNRERDEEEAARDHFTAHGHWPGE